MEKLVAFVLLVGCGSVNAALVGRAPDSNGVFQAVYDTDWDVTWVADANLAATMGSQICPTECDIASGGRMLYDAYGRPGIEDWVDALNDYSGDGYLGVSSWRLPKFNGTSPNELDHLVQVELDHLSGDSSDASLFTNLPLDFGFRYYWTTGSCHYINGVCLAKAAYLVRPNTTFVSYDNGSSILHHAWTVADGDVLASAVPIPAAAYLFASGLGLLGWTRRRKAQFDL